MKLVFIAIFSVILLVVCEPQQHDVIGNGEAPGLYYKFGKRYGWNFDNRHDENNRYEEVYPSYSLERGRDTKKEYNSREQSHRRNSERVQRPDHGRYNKDDSESREKSNHRDSDHGQRLDRGRDNKDKYDSREQMYHRKADRGRDDHRYEHNHQRNDRHRDGHNESSEKQRDNRYQERRNHNYKTNNEYQSNDKQYDRIEGSDKVDNRDDKSRDENKNRDYSRENQNNNRNEDKHRNKDHGYENRKDNKSRERNNERDRNQSYANDHRGYDNNRNNERNNNGRQYQNENDRHKEDISKEYGFENIYNNKNNKYDNSNYNYGSSKNQDRKESKNYDNDNFRHYDGQQGNLQKDKEAYDYNYKGQENDERKQNTRIITEDHKGNKKDDHSAPYHYSYIESLITAPNQNEGKPKTKLTNENKNQKDDYERKESQDNKKKEEVIEIHGVITKNKDFNDKEVKVDVIVKKNDDTEGKVHESMQNRGHNQVNKKEGIHMYKALNKVSPEKETHKSQEGNKYENDNDRYGKSNNSEKNYREGYNNHVQGKKDLFGGIELLGLIGNIGQEFKEQVIERIPGYHLLQSLENRGHISGNKQQYNYNLEKKGPKIDLEVYSPDFKHNEENEKKVKKIQVSSEISNKGKVINIHKEKEMDIYTNTRGKDRNQSTYQQGERKAGYDYSISHNPVLSGDKSTNKYIENQEEYKTQPERDYVNQKDQGSYNEQNSRNQRPNYVNKQSKDDQGLSYYNQKDIGYQLSGYVNENNRGFINQDLGEYQWLGNRQEKVSQIQEPRKTQEEEKYIFQYTIGKKLDEKKGLINYNVPYFLPYDDSNRVLQNKQEDVYRQGLKNMGEDYSRNNYYNLRYDYSNDKSNYETKPNEGWTYQGFSVMDPKMGKIEEKYNNIDYNSKDGRNAEGYIRIGNQGQGYKNQQMTEVNYGYPSPANYMNKGNLYTPKYNQGIIGTGHDMYQPPHYPITDLVNPLSEQILGSVGKVQDYYNQNSTKTLVGWSNHNEGYNVNPYLADYGYPEPYYSDNYQHRYTRPIDTSYQGSNKEYMYQNQLPYSNVFVRIGLPY